MDVLRAHRFQNGRGELQPFAQVRHGFARRIFAEQRRHRAALRMAADDDVAHAQRLDGKLDGGGGGIGAARRIRGRDDVADVFHDEEVARLALRDEFRQHARIRAGDEQRVRVLPFLRQLAKKFPVIAELVPLKLVNACDELFHFSW